VVSGNHILEMFDIRDPKLIGVLKNTVRDAILDGEIPNEEEAALAFTRQKGLEMGLQARN
jgi:hypothetical protein